jgi:probable rRNA maturation factor
MTPPAGGRKASPRIEVIIMSPRWRKKPRSAVLIRKAIAEAAKSGSRRRLKSGSPSHTELAIVLTDDSAIRALNREWRKLDAPTNVLSFPAKAAGASRHLPRHLGDIVIAYETTAREARAEGKSFDHHLVHLAVHGYLHLLGYDHATDGDAENMEHLEIAILARLAVPDPYAHRGV